jgi:hypothetical protein
LVNRPERYAAIPRTRITDGMLSKTDRAMVRPSNSTINVVDPPLFPPPSASRMKAAPRLLSGMTASLLPASPT